MLGVALFPSIRFLIPNAQWGLVNLNAIIQGSSRRVNLNPFISHRRLVTSSVLSRQLTTQNRR